MPPAWNHEEIQQVRDGQAMCMSEAVLRVWVDPRRSAPAVHLLAADCRVTHGWRCDDHQAGAKFEPKLDSAHALKCKVRTPPAL